MSVLGGKTSERWPTFGRMMNVTSTLLAAAIAVAVAGAAAARQ